MTQMHSVTVTYRSDCPYAAFCQVWEPLRRATKSISVTIYL